MIDATYGVFKDKKNMFISSHGKRQPHLCHTCAYVQNFNLKTCSTAMKLDITIQYYAMVFQIVDFTDLKNSSE